MFISTNMLNKMFKQFDQINSPNFIDNFFQAVNDSAKESSTYFSTAGTYPKMDILNYKKEQKCKIIFDVRGYTKEQLKLTIDEDKNMLVLAVDKNDPYSDITNEDEYILLKEIKNSKSTRSIELPEYIDVKTASAQNVGGYLVCTIKYKQEKAKDIKELEIV